MTDRMIKVLVADDSAVSRMSLVHLLESDPQIRVVGAVADGQAAVDFVLEKRPDIVLMDIVMPRLDGFDATRRIMESQALPIVICSATSGIKDVLTTFQAIEAGALACVEKPPGRGHADFEPMAAHLVETVKLMAEVRVVRRTPMARIKPSDGRPPAPAPVARARAQCTMVGIGASTGGPPALQIILAGLPKNFAAPLLIVQHIARGFLPGMVEWLNQSTGVHTQIARSGTTPLPGQAYLAPDDFHMGIGAGGAIMLTRSEPEHHVRPAVSFLFRSLASEYGSKALGVLLTGMGSDGAAELKLLRDRGAYTIAQDQQSSVVHGMPGVAIALGGASHVLPDTQIADALTKLVEY